MHQPFTVHRLSRNAPCPCGSGKRFKRCCFDKVTMLKEAEEKSLESRNAEESRVRRFGHVRPFISTQFQGHTFVVAGDEVHFLPTSHCQTAPDFLRSYLRRVLGGDFHGAELERQPDERHPVVQWDDEITRHLKGCSRNTRGLLAVPCRGPNAALQSLAYDLFVLKDNAELHDDLVHRLRHRDQFQGARYEAFVAAAFVRAGYDIAFEDESDKTVRHPEFVATHKATGQKIALEAKSKHRPGVLGHPGVRKIDACRPGVRRLLTSAIKKTSRHPYIVFVDLNLPSTGQPTQEKPWYPEVTRLARQATCSDDGLPCKLTLLVFTNVPHHYVSITGTDPQDGDFVGKGAEVPNARIAHFEALEALRRSLHKADQIPSSLLSE